MIIGIDASNIRAGGGLTHLGQLLSHAAPERNHFSRIIVWGGRQTLTQLPEKAWLEKVHSRLLDLPLPARVAWQQAMLPKEILKHSCNVLFSPGGTTPATCSVPVVTMSQNLLPFSVKDVAYYPLLSPFRIKMSVLRKVQTRSMRRADGVIFLTNYAKDTLLPIIAGGSDKHAVIPHGIEDRFFSEPRKARTIGSYSAANPFRVTYVSIIDNYKHQVEVAIAVAAVHKAGVPVDMTFIGPARPGYFSKFKSLIGEVDPNGEFLHYSGNLFFSELHTEYRNADLFLFASSCENLPNILLEAMASGTPVVCSNKGPMPEVLGPAGLYFDPEIPAEIETAMHSAIADPELRDKIAWDGYGRAKKYSWRKCADATFAYINSVAK